MNILVIRTHRFGDILQLTPMLQGLKSKHPEGRVTFLTGDDMVDLVSGNPDVDEVVSIPEKEYRFHLKNRPDCYARIYNELYDLVSELKRRDFQLIVNRQYEFGGIMAWLVGAEEVLGGTFSPEGGFTFEDDLSKQLSETIRTNRNHNQRNLVDWGCRLAGTPPGCGRMVFHVAEADRWASGHLLSEGGARDGDRLVAVQLGAARSFRQWGTENYAQVIEWLMLEKRKTVVLLGTEDEKELSQTVCHDLGTGNGGVIDLLGKTDFGILGGVLERCECLITGDTGTMHMAAAVGTPVLAIFYGTAYPWETGPHGTGHLVLYADQPCSPCLVPGECISGHRCLRSVTPRHVRKAFEVFESTRRDQRIPITWLDSEVKLYLTRVRAGSDQVLIPIDGMGQMAEGILPVLDDRYVARPDRQGVESAVTMFGKQRDLLLKQFYLGNKQRFIVAFSEFIDQFYKILGCLMANPHITGNGETLSRELVPAIGEACTAFEAEDFVTVLDIVNYRFTPAMERLTRRGFSAGVQT